MGGAFIKAHAKSHNITAMSRSEKSDAALIALGAKPVRCSLDDVSAAHMSGCETVIHCAAAVDEWAPWAYFRRVNIGGTKNTLAAARATGAKRFIHIGTESALFYGQHMRGIDETYPLCFKSPFPYGQTKAYAEQAVIDASQDGFETIILRPRMIWGPGDQTVIRAIKDMADAGKFVWVDGGRAAVSTTHIDNLVHAMQLALSKGGSGEAYFILDDGQTTLRKFLSAYLKTANCDLGSKSVPGWFLRPLAAALETIWRGLRLKSAPPIGRYGVCLMSRDCILIDKKARAQMSYAPVISREEGLTSLSNTLA